MVARRPPSRLEDLSFNSWLFALDIGISSPVLAPPVFLSRALLSGAKLRDATVVKVAAAAASSAGVDQLNIEGEFLNPALLKQLVVVLLVNPEKLESLTLDLSPRITSDSTWKLLVKALSRTINLRHLRLLGGANDKLLASLAGACPPLKLLDLSYSESVTDAGLLALLDNPLEGFHSVNSSMPLDELQQLNVWGTKVTTRGCISVLRRCFMLTAVTCQWTAEALILLEMQESNPLRLEKLLIADELLHGNLLKSISNMCPCLRSLTIRKPRDSRVDINEVCRAVPLVEDLSILQFLPVNPLVLEIPEIRGLTRIHLNPLTAPYLYLDNLSSSCPMLKHLILDGIHPKLSESTLKNKFSPGISFPYLEELRLITPFTSVPLDPDMLSWSVRNTRILKRLDLGSCILIHDDVFLDLLYGGYLKLVEDLLFTRAIKLTDMLIHTLVNSCSYLKRIALKMLTKERLAEIETLKVNLRMQNLDVELITYGHFYTGKTSLQS